MTVRDYTVWVARQRARRRADVEMSMVVLACCLAGMAGCLWLAGILAGGW